jgi:hypothetical protein
VVTSAGRPQVGRGTGTATTCGRVLEHAQLAPNVSMADAIEQARTDLDAEVCHGGATKTVCGCAARCPPG